MYRVSSRTARVTKRNPVLKQEGREGRRDGGREGKEREDLACFVRILISCTSFWKDEELATLPRVRCSPT